MRILVEPSAHHLLNAGDTAMLQIAIERLQGLWPHASIGVITESAERLSVECPQAVPVPAAGRELWLEQPSFSARAHRVLPRRAAARLRTAERALRRRRPVVASAAIRMRRKLKGLSNRELRDFLDWAWRAELVVVSGAGLLADPFAPRAVTVLELLESAIGRGASTAMFGQGVGYFGDPDLLSMARAVLPHVDVMGLREQRTGRPFLRGLGVPEQRMFTTGDDAVEVAFRARPEHPVGSGIGVALRVARYSGVRDGHLESVGMVLKRAARARSTELVPVPVSRVANEGDLAVLRRALGRDVEAAPSLLEEPAPVIEQVQRCRVVVAGSYHAGVFALAQGIPAIGLAGSQYYVEKFLGLADQFDGHCPVVRLDEPGLGERLGAALDEAWGSADDLRAPLIRAAERQVVAGRAAYRALHRVVSERGRGSPRTATAIPAALKVAGLASVARRKVAVALDPRRRFNCQDQDNPSWDERASEAVQLLIRSLDNGATDGTPLEVGDFGCGNERLRAVLERELDRPLRYQGYDLHPQSSNIERLDIERDMPDRSFDVVFCLGLVEYVSDVESLARRLREVCSRAVVSYVIRDSTEVLTRDERAARGWRNHYSRSEIEAVFTRSGYRRGDAALAENGRTVIWLWTVPEDAVLT